MHVISMAGILSIFPSLSHFVSHFVIFRGLWVPVLDGDWAAERLLPFRGELPGDAFGMQLALPYRGPFPAFPQRWVQWNGRLGFQFCTQWRNSLAVPQVLREEALEKEKCG